MLNADLTDSLAKILNCIAAAGALGTAAYGLVDATKMVKGGMSNPGFSFIRNAVISIIGPVAASRTVFGPAEIIATLRANWLNGVSKADQKAAAKALIRLMLTSATAPAMATATGVNAAHLQTAAEHIRDDADITPQDIKTLGAFDVVVSATLDLGYERGDQFYRNSAKVAAAGCAIVLAVGGSYFVYGANPVSSWLPLAVFIGVVATPLAPIVKDLSSSLSAAVKAGGAFKR
ncbi:MAG: hypothetical protein PSV46_17045 [Reyranella sp.]|nr:hypothetical protein [Reyranella sp.]